MTLATCSRCGREFLALTVAGEFDPKRLARGQDPFVTPEPDALDGRCLACLDLGERRAAQLKIRRRAKKARPTPKKKKRR